jgi:hypothetical protein
MRTQCICLALAASLAGSFASAQVELFDFDNAPLHSSLPIDQTVSGISAHLMATGQGYSIQEANVLGFTPPGFAGRILYPNSIYLADLLVRFDQVLTDFSIMYSCQELGCDDAATMRVTAFMNGNFVGTNTRTATFPGTWPVDTLRCSFPQGFDSVVVHYDSHPPTCQDYGVIYMADNMRVTPFNLTAISEDEVPEKSGLSQNYPNPFNPSTDIRFQITDDGWVTLRVYDVLGREVATLVDEVKHPGAYTARWDAGGQSSGVYIYRLKTGNVVQTKRMMLIR